MRKNLKKYDVEICRTGYSFATFSVEAENKEEAEALAMEEAYNHLFSEKDSDYVTESIIEEKSVAGTSGIKRSPGR